MSTDIPIPQLPDLDKKDMYRLFNKKACDSVLPGELKRIISWGCPKRKDETFWSYLEDKNKSNLNKYIKMWANYEREKLKQIDCHNYDTTVLYKLIPEVCENIEKGGLPVWTIEDDAKIESILKRLKDLRNDVMHQPDVAAIDPESLRKLEDLLIKLIKVSGKLYSRCPFECEDICKEIKNTFSRIEDMFITKKDKILSQVQVKLRNEGIEEMKTHWEIYYDKISLPPTNQSVKLKDVYHPSDLQLCNEQGQIVQQISCIDIISKWAYPAQESKMFILEGSAGSGKSTTLRALSLDFFQGCEQRIFKGLENFGLLLYVTGRDDTTLSLGDLISKTFENVIKGIDIDDVITAILRMKVLIFIDGIDEMSTNSKKFIHSLIVKCKSNDLITIIATSRPFATVAFKQFLEDEQIPFSTAKVKEMTDENEQKIFLSRYAAAMSSSQKTYILNSFMKHSKDIKEQLFRHPIQLVLHCHLCVHSGSNLKNLTSEADLMREMVNLCRQMMIERLKLENLDQSVAAIIFKSLYQTSLECLLNDRFYLSVEECGKFHEDVIKKLKTHVSGHLLLSCVLVAESHGLQGSMVYTYFHKSQQEYLAAKALLSTLNENKDTDLFQTLKKALIQGSSLKSSFFKFQNVIKFLIAELAESSLLNAQADDLTKFLEECSVKVSFCQDLVLRCNMNKQVANIVINACKDKRKWTISEVQHFKTTSILLEWMQPERLKIVFVQKVPEELKEFMTDIAKCYTGNLTLYLHESFKSFIPCDEYIECLRNSKCKLIYLLGCISKQETAALLFDLKISKLDLALDNVKNHNLIVFDKNIREIRITIRIQEDISAFFAENAKKPLPDGKHEPAFLTVSNVSQDQVMLLESTISYLAPQHKTFSQLCLMRCCLSDEKLDQLSFKLGRAEIFTKTGHVDNAIKWEEWMKEDGVCLFCNDEHGNEEVDRCVRFYLRELHLFNIEAETERLRTNQRLKNERPGFFNCCFP